jgi:ABC-type lipoprotein release transport system permease subunit
MIFYESFNEGARGKMIDDAVAMYSGYIQIHGKGYQDSPNYDYLIYDVAEVEKELKDVKGIDVIAKRLETFGLYSTKADSIGGMLTGVEPSKEEQVSRIKRALQEGRFLEDNDTNGVYIGVELAKRLEVGLGDEVILLSSAVDYSMAATRLKIVGTFRTNFHDFDSRAAFINKKLMDQEFLAENIASHIIIKPKDKLQTVKLAKALRKRVDKENYEVLTWKTTMKEMVQFMQIDYTMDHLSFGLLLIIVFFVILFFSLISIFI